MQRVSIFILNWNGIEMTKRCLTAIAALSTDSVDVCVLDNGSINPNEFHELETFKSLMGAIPTHFFQSDQNLGFAAGMNHLVRLRNNLSLPSSDYYLFLNNDAFLTADILDSLLVAANQNPQFQVFGPLIQETNTNRTAIIGAGKIQFWTGSTNFSETAPPDALQECDFVHGACFLVRNPTFLQLGGFDEKYFAYYEETDFCARLTRAGGKTAIVKTNPLEHFGSHSAAVGVYSASVNARKEYLMLRNRRRFVRKNGSFLQAFTCQIYCLVYWGPRRLVGALLRLDFPRAWAVIRGVFIPT